MVDLFYFSPEWKSQQDGEKSQDVLDHGSDFPQVVIYSGNDADDPFAAARLFKDKVVVWSDNPDAEAKAMYIPSPLCT